MYQMIIGTYSKRNSRGIYLLEVDDVSRQGRIVSAIEEKNPSYLCLDPTRKRLYTALENEIGQVAVYDIGNRKAPVFIGRYKTGGGTTCHVSLSQDYRRLYASNYEEGSITVFEVGDSFEKSRIFYNQAKEFAQGAHAHSTFSVGEDEIICCDKGLDSILLYQGGKEMSRFYLEGSNFRILERKGQIFYLVAERSSEIVVVSYEQGEFILRQRISTVAKGFSEINYAAAVHLSPNQDYLYASNRGEDSIVIYKIQKGGILELVDRVYLPGQFPRDFGISKDGMFLCAALEYSDCLVFYDVDRKAGTIRPWKETIQIPSPTAVIIE